jgi:hypothetical protein
MRKQSKLATIGLAAVITGAVAVGAISVTAASGDSATAAARRANAKYHDISTATHDGYGLFKDANGIACIDMPGMGAMGVHYVKGAIVGDGAVDALAPEALVYAPDHGHLRLAALEYVVFQSDWDKNHSSPPSLFGHPFSLTASPNRFGLPPYYSLHAWLYKKNPAGTFAPWNPRVSCASTHDRHGDMEDMPGMG